MCVGPPRPCAPAKRHQVRHDAMEACGEKEPERVVTSAVGHVQVWCRDGIRGHDDRSNVAEIRSVVGRSGQAKAGRNLVEGRVQALGTGDGFHSHRGHVGPGTGCRILCPLALGDIIAAEEVRFRQLCRHRPRPRHGHQKQRDEVGGARISPLRDPGPRDGMLLHRADPGSQMMLPTCSGG